MLRIITLWILLAAFLLPSGHEASVFYSSREANQVLKIQKRANTFLEELKPGSLERECTEEVCDLEEASEIFKSKEATLNFWSKYFDGDQCESSPCFNGTCVDSIGRFECTCNQGWEGRLCQYEVNYTNCSTSNGGCEHFCNEDQENDQHRYCTCASGYRLMDNYTSCEPDGAYPCGRIVPITPEIAKVIGGKIGRKGDSPWQVMLFNEKGKFDCGAVLIHPSWVLTAAHCVVGQERVKLKFGKYYRWRKEEGVQIVVVDKIFAHENYSDITSDNDIAMLHLPNPVVFSKSTLPICLPTKKLAEQELMREGTPTVVTGWGNQNEAPGQANYSSVLQYIDIPVVSRNDCVSAMINGVSENMLCAGIQGDKRDSCNGDSGGPMVTKFKDTWFLIGLVSWGEEGCGKLDNFGVYTKVSQFLEWIDQQIKTQTAST
ncbi:vitamin K-dependent protein C isoform X2 [Hemicordylus capensis]|uniref:vitamin K-dependent protein C isoform X2 n=1 Tax=Hemicordylus capensis TaxID=884348 RepID=UPI002302FD33|nr:vitamin K-dependent protein C isoform X2 [Hemicordylus capensis]XP_053162260.1 vitamin K-dependent protein C isoform X2 [Hemicordylus capensis]